MANIKLNKAKARDALLKMAEAWDKKGWVQNAIEGYESVIEADSKSVEADNARAALLEIAKRFEQEGKRHAAYHLYHKLADGRAGSHNRI